MIERFGRFLMEPGARNFASTALVFASACFVVMCITAYNIVRVKAENKRWTPPRKRED